MVGRGVEGIEAMVFVLDFRTIGDGEPDFAKAANDLIGDLSEGMEGPEGSAAARQGKVGGFVGLRGFKFEFAAALDEGSFEYRLGGVDDFAGRRLIFFRDGPELFQEGGEFAVGTEVIDADLFKAGSVRRRPELGKRRLFQRINLVEKPSHRIWNLAVKARREHKEMIGDK
jgi:hypothetical protein